MDTPPGTFKPIENPSDPKGWRMYISPEAAEANKLHRRERIATAVLAGFAADHHGWRAYDAVNVSVEWADALIAELDKE